MDVPGCGARACNARETGRLPLLHRYPDLADTGAEWLSGDRPGIRLTKSAVLACGMPWDGKERIYRNAAVPLLAHLLAEYDVDKATAARDLDNLLDTLRGYDMLEEDMA